MRRFVTTALLLLTLAANSYAPSIVPQTPARGVVVAGGGGSAPTLVSTSPLNADSNADDPESWSITTGAIANGCVIMYVTTLKGSYITSCTFDGTAMTALAQGVGADTVTRVEIWGLKLATKSAGTYTVAPSGTSGGNFKGIAQTWNGVNQTTPFGTGVTATGTGTAVTVSITSGANDIVGAAVMTFGTFSFTAGSGYTVIANDSTAASTDHLSQYKQAASVADATISGISQWVVCAVAIQP